MITVVSGLARCGTSLVMKMLDVGGMGVFADNNQSYETHLTSYLPLNFAWLDKCENKAIKILDPHIFTPPRTYQYRFIWMRRNFREQAKSQLKFLKALMFPTQRADLSRFVKRLKHDTPKCLSILRQRGPVLVCCFEDVIKKPDVEANRISKFCGGLNVDAMITVPWTRQTECLPYLAELDEKTVEF